MLCDPHWVLIEPVVRTLHDRTCTMQASCLPKYSVQMQVNLGTAYDWTKRIILLV